MIYGYARVSTARQAGEGESLDVQQRQITGYALMHGLGTPQMLVERGVSGATPLQDRPAGKALLVALKPGDIIITPKLDRMFRSALDALDVLARLKAQGVALHMLDLGGDVTGNGISKLVFTILSAVAEAERDRIRERVSQVKADQKARGRYLGGFVPFGYLIGDNGELVSAPEKQAAIAKAKAMRNDGTTLEAIRTALRAEGHAISMGALHKLLRA